MKTQQKTAILLSGGVDSSVALRLLQEQGVRNITAFYLKIWLEDELAFLGDCPWEEDLGYVRAVCKQANVPLEIVPLQHEYFEQIVAHAIEELRAGRTPSPDIRCNQYIKFGAFCETAGASFDRIASGHYARIREENGRFHLYRAPDPVKDQTYFLSRLTQEQLRRAWFPIGELHKSEVRALAEKMALPNRARKDSQGICFLGKIRYPEFVRFHLGEQDGDIIDEASGRVLGHHRGYWFYTIGQRQGIGLSGGPWYVSGKDIQKNIVYVAHRDRLAQVSRNRCILSHLHWIDQPPEPGELLYTKIRHGPELKPCRLEPVAPVIQPNLRTPQNYAATQGSEVNSRTPQNYAATQLLLEEADSGIAAGQTAVLYRDDCCLGCGMIELDRLD